MVLIGMPGAGKSTIGQLLARHWGWDFVDTDRVFEQRLGVSLQSVIDEEGLSGFLLKEEASVLSLLRKSKVVISTGGSVVLSEKAMGWLQNFGSIVYLEAQLPTISARIGNWSGRGFAIAPGQSLEDVYRQRTPLYQQYADHHVSVDERNVESILEEIQGLCI